MWSNHCLFIQLLGKEVPLSERVVSDLISGHDFQGKHLYFSLLLDYLENLKLQDIKACGSIRTDRAGIPSDFAKKNRMQRGDCKSIITSNSIVFIWMDTTQVGKK